MLELSYYSLTDVGRVRGNNEDAAGAYVPGDERQRQRRGYLFAVADGVGGQRQGEVASAWAIAGLLEGFASFPAHLSHRDALSRLIAAVNDRIFTANLKSGHGGMATTLVACALQLDRATIAHLGDSRCYLFRQGILRALTQDHNLAAEQLRLGLVGADGDSPNRNLLTRSLGTEMTARTEIAVHQLRAGDRLLLCSDGLHAAVEAEAIAACLRRNLEPRSAAERLIALANEAGGGDNITVQVIQIQQVEATGMYRGRPYALR